MKYSVVTRDIQNLRSLQDIIMEEDPSEELFLECDVRRAMKSKRIRDVDILLVELALYTFIF